MKAVTYDSYGPPEVLRLEEIPKPVPKDDEILIRVEATTATSGDWRVRSLDVPRGFGLMARLALGVFRPRQRILGTELAGEVESIGKKVSKFRIGDRVFAFTDTRMGCYVEYKCMPEDGVVAAIPT
jgi:NADPH:quinone reductase-like Zn-dependent oxidoreductase